MGMIAHLGKLLWTPRTRRLFALMLLMLAVSLVGAVAMKRLIVDAKKATVVEMNVATVKESARVIQRNADVSVNVVSAQAASEVRIQKEREALVESTRSRVIHVRQSSAPLAERNQSLGGIYISSLWEAYCKFSGDQGTDCKN